MSSGGPEAAKESVEQKRPVLIVVVRHSSDRARWTSLIDYLQRSLPEAEDPILLREIWMDGLTEVELQAVFHSTISQHPSSFIIIVGLGPAASSAIGLSAPVGLPISGLVLLNRHVEPLGVEVGTEGGSTDILLRQRETVETLLGSSTSAISTQASSEEPSAHRPDTPQRLTGRLLILDDVRSRDMICGLMVSPMDRADLLEEDYFVLASDQPGEQLIATVCAFITFVT